jgi:hypothetical protein
VLWKIENQIRVRQTNNVKLVTNEQVINAVNQIALSEEHQATQPMEEMQETQAEIEEELTIKQPEILQETQQSIQKESTQETQEGAMEETQEGTVEETQEGTQQQTTLEPQESGDVEAEDTDQTVRTRSGRAVVRPSRFMAVMKLSHDEWKTAENAKAINLELKMLFEDLKALRVVKRASIKAGTKILRSHMFVVEKYLAGGAFDKMKARLIADGRDQESSMYPDKASPTVAIHSVFTVLGLMASKKWLTVAKVDVKGVFVQTPMDGESVNMKIDPKITAYVISLYPKLREFVEVDGCLYTVMLKAMYGCIQASSLWYQMLRKLLEQRGYEMSQTDHCVFRKMVGDRIFILLVYVDDILALVDKTEAEKLQKFLDNRFGKVQFEVGRQLSYLGMRISI